jgi:hypothetical protein
MTMDQMRAINRHLDLAALLAEAEEPAFTPAD